MNRWVIDIDNMMFWHVKKIGPAAKPTPFKYVPKENKCYYYWSDGKWNGWDECVPEIRDAARKSKQKA